MVLAIANTMSLSLWYDMLSVSFSEHVSGLVAAVAKLQRQPNEQLGW